MDKSPSILIIQHPPHNVKCLFCEGYSNCRIEADSTSSNGNGWHTGEKQGTVELLVFFRVTLSLYQKRLETESVKAVVGAEVFHVCFEPAPVFGCVIGQGDGLVKCAFEKSAERFNASRIGIAHSFRHEA